MKTFPPSLSADEEQYYMQKYQFLDEDMEDLISIGTIGLIKAIISFNPDKNSRLGTYAARCIENAILTQMCL